MSSKKDTSDKSFRQQIVEAVKNAKYAYAVAHLIENDDISCLFDVEVHENLQLDQSLLDKYLKHIKKK